MALVAIAGRRCTYTVCTHYTYTATPAFRVTAYTLRVVVTLTRTLREGLYCAALPLAKSACALCTLLFKAVTRPARPARASWSPGPAALPTRLARWRWSAARARHPGPCSLTGTSCTPHAAPQSRAAGGVRQEVSSYSLPRRVTALNSRICLVMATSTGSLSIELAFRFGYRVRVRVRVRVRLAP